MPELREDQASWQPIFDRFNEKKAIENIESDIGQQQRAIALAGRILAIRNSPGFEDFKVALEDIRNYALQQLSRTTESNDQMRVLQGQVQAYENVLGVVLKGENRVKALEEELRRLQNQKALIVRPQTARVS